MIRNIFKGGPADTQVHLTADLTADPDLIESVPFEEYDGTSPTYMMADGVEARDWIHRLDWATQETPAEEPTGPIKKEATMANHAVEAGDLEARRKSLKLSRKQLSDLTGISQAKIVRIETKGGSEEEVAALTNALDAAPAPAPAVAAEPADEAVAE